MSGSLEASGVRWPKGGTGIFTRRWWFVCSPGHQDKAALLSSRCGSHWIINSISPRITTTWLIQTPK